MVRCLPECAPPSTLEPNQISEGVVRCVAPDFLNGENPGLFMRNLGTVHRENLKLQKE